MLTRSKPARSGGFLFLLVAGVTATTQLAFSQDLAHSVIKYESLATEVNWNEAQPGNPPTTSQVSAPIWNTAIQAALTAHGAVYLPKRDKPYYLDGPILLASGQKLHADRDAEIRLKPHTNTCMVRNANLLGYSEQAVPEDTKPDHNITIEGGIWTANSTQVNRANGNLRGLSDKKNPIPGTHGIILLQNVRDVAIRNVTVKRSTAFAIQLANVRNFTVNGIRLVDHGRDGVHVNGPASDGIIRDVSGNSHDDTVSICAWDWKNCAPSFGPVERLLIENIRGVPLDLPSADAIRLLPGVKRFADGKTLDCPISDITIRNTQDIREYKFYDQPNLELGRDNDSSVEVGTLKNIRLENLTLSRPGKINIAAHVQGFVIDGIDLNYPTKGAYDLIKIGPMSATYKAKANDPSTWVEIFSPDRDITVRGFQLKNVRARGTAIPNPQKPLVTVQDQKPNPDYPKTHPRGGTGRVFMEK